jgi:hypothetical protein
MGRIEDLEQWRHAVQVKALQKLEERTSGKYLSTISFTPCQKEQQLPVEDLQSLEPQVFSWLKH